MLRDYIRDRRLLIETNITSNVQTRAVARAAEHPVRAYFDAGLVVTLCTDGWLMTGVTLSDEYWLAHTRARLHPAGDRPADPRRLRQRVSARGPSGRLWSRGCAEELAALRAGRLVSSLDPALLPASLTHIVGARHADARSFDRRGRLPLIGARHRAAVADPAASPGAALAAMELPARAHHRDRRRTMQRRRQAPRRRSGAADRARRAGSAPPAGLGTAGRRASLWTACPGLVGLALILAIGIALSHNRRAIRWRVIAWGLGLQLLFAIFVLRIPAGQALFRWLGDLVTGILSYSYIGSRFVFGELGKQHSSLGVIFAFQLLPAIIFVSALFAILYYLGIMQLIVRAFAVVMSRVMGASGAESLNVAASIFMGQTEAPLTIRPFLPRMTRSELMTVMTSGMAHISGSIMVAYIAFGIEARHLLTAVIMTAPGTIMMAKLFEPETETPETYGTVTLDMPSRT